MSKLFRLKEWLTVKDAARYLSDRWREDVSEADVLQLALDEKVVLSVIFGHVSYARKWEPVNESEIRWEQFPQEDGSVFKAPIGNVVPFESNWYKESSEVVPIPEGPWDLVMMNSVRNDVMTRLKLLTGELGGDSSGSYGVLIKSIDGDLYALQKHVEHDGRVRTDGRPYWHQANFHDARALPSIASLVIRTKVLNAFLENLTDSSIRQEGSLGSRERTSYLNIIGALLELVTTPRPGRESQNDVIQELIENYSDKPGISKSNLETKFAQANKSLRN